MRCRRPRTPPRGVALRASPLRQRCACEFPDGRATVEPAPRRSLQPFGAVCMATLRRRGGVTARCDARRARVASTPNGRVGGPRAAPSPRPRPFWTARPFWPSWRSRRPVSSRCVLSASSPLREAPPWRRRCLVVRRGPPARLAADVLGVERGRAHVVHAALVALRLAREAAAPAVEDEHVARVVPLLARQDRAEVASRSSRGRCSSSSRGAG